jgi:hypothetical protein
MYEGKQYSQHIDMLVDAYDPQGQLVGQVRNGDGFIQDFSGDGQYRGIETYQFKNRDQDVSQYYDDITKIGKERLVAAKDPRYPPKEMPKSERLPFDTVKYGRITPKK